MRFCHICGHQRIFWNKVFWCVLCDLMKDADHLVERTFGKPGYLLYKAKKT